MLYSKFAGTDYKKIYSCLKKKRKKAKKRKKKKKEQKKAATARRSIIIAYRETPPLEVLVVDIGYFSTKGRYNYPWK